MGEINLYEEMNTGIFVCTDGKIIGKGKTVKEAISNFDLEKEKHDEH